MRLALQFKSVVDLSYNCVRARGKNGTRPIIVNLHGFLGAKSTFHSLTKTLSQSLDTDIYTLDLRNHGDSPQCHPMSYDVLARDLMHFFKTHFAQDVLIRRGVHLIGYSMGAKVGLLNAIKFQQQNIPIIRKIISIDMPPYETPVLPMELIQNYQLIEDIHSGKITIKPGTTTWRQECVGILGWYFASGFFKVKENNNILSKNGHIKYYLPLEQFPDMLHDLKGWPRGLSKTIKCDNTKVLFMRGLNSPLFNDNYQLLNKHFPQNKVMEFNTGHNLLFEEFEMASTSILEFLQE